MVLPPGMTVGGILWAVAAGFAAVLAVVLLLMVSTCDKQPIAGPQGEKGAVGEKGEKGERGERGQKGDQGPNWVVRFVDGECRSPCTISCEANERILAIHAINPGGTLVYEDDGRATFRPQRQGASTRVVVACVPK